MQIEIHPEIEAELLHTTAHYENNVPELGADFLGEFHEAVARIASFPEIGVVAESPYRRVLLSRFPYSVFYRVRGSALRIVAASHQRRLPGYWIKRR